MGNQTLVEENKNLRWGFAGTLLWGLFVAILYLVVQVIVVFIYAQIVHGNISEEIMKQVEYDGNAISLATFATLIICGLVVCGIIKLKKGSNISEYLSINKITSSQIKHWALIVFALIILSDSLTYLLGKPIVVEFMTTVYNSTSHLWLLALALIFAAPIFEELFFRGFLFSGFSSTFLGSIGAIVVTSAAWAVIHIQYDLYSVFTIFIAGLVLGVARLKTNSILTTIMMHSIMNIVATIETVIYVANQA